jgi:hypothetical protein
MIFKSFDVEIFFVYVTFALRMIFCVHIPLNIRISQGLCLVIGYNFVFLFNRYVIQRPVYRRFWRLPGIL